jgi:cellobiose-specific phosphotransferase system component IIB
MDIGNLKEHAIPFITQLQRDCERRGLGDIYFVRGAAGELEGNIMRKVSDLVKRGLITDIRDVDIVLVGKKVNMENKCYQTLEGEESFTMVNIDDAAISELNYVPLPEILAFAVAVASGQDNNALSRLYEKITGLSISAVSIDAMKRLKQFTIKLPQTEPVDYHVLKKMYELARACLSAA